MPRILCATGFDQAFGLIGYAAAFSPRLVWSPNESHLGMHKILPHPKQIQMNSKLTQIRNETPEISEVKLARIAKAYGCTEDGITWMKNALDPFPDVKRPVVGYPDSSKTPSIVQYFREEQTVSVPGNVSSGNPWDCNIYHPGYYGNGTLYLTPSVTTQSDQQFVGITLPQTTPYAYGGLEVRAGPAGTALAQSALSSAIPEAVDLGFRNRIVAYAMEIFNTTPDLYKGGALCTWRQTAEENELLGTVVKPGSTPNPSAFRATELNDIPITISEALNLEGSLQWDAEEGAYCVATQADTENVYRSKNDNRAIVMLSNNNWYTDVITSVDSFNAPDVTRCKSPFNAFGAFFTGLPFQSTLQVVKHYLIERLPTYVNQDLITLCKQPPAYDPRALELYSNIAGFLPTGCPVEDNFLGAFLSGLASIARAVAPRVLPQIAKTITETVMKKDPGNSIVVYREPNRQMVLGNSSSRMVDTFVDEVMVPVGRSIVEKVVVPRATELVERIVTPNKAPTTTVATAPRTISNNTFMTSNRAMRPNRRRRGKRLLARAMEGKTF